MQGVCHQDPGSTCKWPIEDTMFKNSLSHIGIHDQEAVIEQDDIGGRIRRFCKRYTSLVGKGI